MKKIVQNVFSQILFAGFLTFCFSGGSAHSTPPRKLLVMGDSWARFMCDFKSFEKVLEYKSLPLQISPYCWITAQNGLKAGEWLGSDIQRKSDQVLVREKPDFIYLSLGGNDLGPWTARSTQNETDELYDTAISNIQKILTHLHEIAPQAKVLVSGYDYARLLPDNRIKAYQRLYQQMDRPTPLQVNRLLTDFSQRLSSKIRDGERTFYIQHFGVLNYYYGLSERDILPFSSETPQTISPESDPDRIGGYPEEPQSEAAMLSLLGYWHDAYHPNEYGFEKIAQHSIETYFEKWAQ